MCEFRRIFLSLYRKTLYPIRDADPYFARTSTMLSSVFYFRNTINLLYFENLLSVSEFDIYRVAFEM